MINQFYIDYIKAIENPDRIGWNGKVWTAPQYKGYDKNQRGYGIDIVKNDSAKRLTQNRPGQWLTEGEADKLMKEHLLYVYGAAQKHIEGFDNLSDRRKAALLGMLYRGDSVNKNRHIIDINEPDDNKFFESISNYYKSKGLNERARNSSNFFNNQTNFYIPMKWEQWEPPMKFKSGGQIRKMLTASGGPIYWLRKRLYNNIEPFGYNDVGSRLINAIVLNKNEHNNFKGDYSDIERAPALYLTIDNIWGEYLHIPEKERRYSKGKYRIKNNGNGTFSLPFESMEDIMQTVNSNNPLLWGLRGKLGNSVVGEYDVHRGYDKNGDYIKYIDHWRINPYDVKEDKEYGLNNNSLLKWYFKGKDDASFGLGTPVEIQGKYYLDDIYNVKGKDRGGHYLPEIIVTGKKKQGGKMNILEFLKNGSEIHIKKKNRGKFTSYCGGKVTDECILKGKNSSNPAIRKRATFAANARKWKHKEGGIIKAGFGLKLSNTVNKIGDFFNSNTGKGLLNLGMQAFGAIKGSIDANNYSNLFDAETNSLLKAMDASQRKNNYKLASQIASEIIKLKQLENPDIHYGPIDKLLLENQIANSLYDDSEMDKYQMLRALEKLKLMEAIQGSSSGILDTVGGILGNFIGNKKDTSTNTSSNNSTFGNYVSTLFKNPGTYNFDGSFNTSLGTYKWEDGKFKNINNTYGTFNADGSMNLGNSLGTISIKDGYKPRKFGILNS